ncbi:hypothetical protein ACOME3_000742 [Neoechinorhynchus agilis]
MVIGSKSIPITNLKSTKRNDANIVLNNKSIYKISDPTNEWIAENETTFVNKDFVDNWNQVALTTDSNQIDTSIDSSNSQWSKGNISFTDLTLLFPDEFSPGTNYSDYKLSFVDLTGFNDADLSNYIIINSATKDDDEQEPDQIKFDQTEMFKEFLNFTDTDGNVYFVDLENINETDNSLKQFSTKSNGTSSIDEKSIYYFLVSIIAMVGVILLFSLCSSIMIVLSACVWWRIISRQKVPPSKISR